MEHKDDAAQYQTTPLAYWNTWDEITPTWGEDGAGYLVPLKPRNVPHEDVTPEEANDEE